MQTIEVRPLKPFIGSYPCALADADFIDDVLTEKDGQLIKTRQARKRFVGRIAIERAPTSEEETLISRNQPLPSPRLEVVDKRTVLEHPEQRTLKLPAEVAEQLIERGLAEKVAIVPEKVAPAKAKATAQTTA